MKPLYELKQQYLLCLNIFTDPESDISPQVIADTLEGLEGDLQDKLVNVVSMSASLDAEAAQVAEAEARMSKRRKALERNAKWLKEYAVSNMLETGIKEVKTAEFKAGVAKNPVGVEITVEPEALPFVYTRQKTIIEPDKKAIKEALESGITIEGCALRQGYRLAIR